MIRHKVAFMWYVRAAKWPCRPSDAVRLAGTGSQIMILMSRTYRTLAITTSLTWHTVAWRVLILRWGSVLELENPSKCVLLRPVYKKLIYIPSDFLWYELYFHGMDDVSNSFGI